MDCFDDLPPAVAYELAEGLVLVAGRHRREAALRLHRTEMQVKVRQGTKEEALEFALLDNLRHGLPLNRAERRRVIAEWLKLHPERSNQWIVQDLGVSVNTVIKVREELEAGFQFETLETLIGRDGKEYPRTIVQPRREPAEMHIETVRQGTETTWEFQS